MNINKVIVFGGAGFLGSYIVKELKKRGYDVTICDLAEPAKHLSDINYERVDILNKKEVLDITNNTDFVFNFAGKAGLEDSINNPFDSMTLNVIGNLNILEACRKNKSLKRFIYASSAYASSDIGSFYGISKHTSEKVTEEYYKKYGLEFNIIRYGSIYGEQKSYNNYLYNLIDSAIKTGKLEYRGSGEETREYIHAADAAKLSVDIIESTEMKNQNFILTGTEKLKKIELLEMINEIMKNKFSIIQSQNKNEGHYKITPYTYHPTTAKKLTANPFIDMGQGLLECIKNIYEGEE